MNDARMPPVRQIHTIARMVSQTYLFINQQEIMKNEKEILTKHYSWLWSHKNI